MEVWQPMLEDSLPRQGREKRVWLQIREPALRAFLEVVLRDWKYQPCDGVVEDGLLLADEGTLEPPAKQQTVWLGQPAGTSPGELRYPLDIAAFRALLESRYHDLPRLHLRLVQEIPCQLEHHGRRVQAAIASLSDRGCRLIYGVELAREMPVRLRFDLAGQPFDLPGKVIYCVPRSDAGHHPYYDLGLLFVDQSRQQRAGLLDVIIASTFYRAKNQLPAELYAAALSCFALNDEVRQYLEHLSGH
jgi:hypothetical protein